MIALPEHPRILVVALRRLGDVLLTTPLIRSLKRAYPEARIDALVFAGTEGILQGNPDLAGIITMPARPSAAEALSLMRSLWRRYDLAISTQGGDRPTWFTLVAGRFRVGPVDRAGGLARTKRFLFHRVIEPNEGLHRIEDVLRLAKAIGVPPVPEVVVPAGAPRRAAERPYAVIHAGPMFRYKRWTEAGWRSLAEALTARGLAVVATGGPSEDERRYLDSIWAGCPVERPGVLAWAELTGLIAGARLYVGPDTSVTHLAAATGTPTVALYGPTDPRLWGPWPVGGLERPWAPAGTIQQRGNVWLVQNPLPCLPCQLEGCERRLDSHSQCLDELTVGQVLTAVNAALTRTSPGLIDSAVGV